MNKQLHIYSGEYLYKVAQKELQIPGCLGNTITVYSQDVDVLHPIYQVEYIKNILESNQERSHMIVCTNSPYALETAMKAGRKYGYTCTVIQVVMGPSGIIEFNKENAAEKCFSDFNKTHDLLDELGPDLEEIV